MNGSIAPFTETNTILSGALNAGGLDLFPRIEIYAFMNSVHIDSAADRPASFDCIGLPSS